MADLYEFKMIIGGSWTGNPGVNIIHSTADPLDSPTSIGNFMNQIKNGWTAAAGYLLNQATFQVSSEVLKKNVETGTLIKVANVTPPAVVTGGGAATSTSHALQANCRHNTDVVADGRRLIGRHFVGPLAQDAIDTDGTLKAAAVTAFNSMWGGMQDIAGGIRLITWHRPILGEHAEGVPAPVIRAGSFGHVQNTVCQDKIAILRSRRD